MSKVMLGLLLGAILGAIDGLSAGFYDAVTKDQLLGIVFGSTGKGLLTGLAADVNVIHIHAGSRTGRRLQCLG